METMAVLLIIIGVFLLSVSKDIGYIKCSSYVCFLLSFCMLIANKVYELMDGVFWQATCLVLLIFGAFIFYDFYRRETIKIKGKRK